MSPKTVVLGTKDRQQFYVHILQRGITSSTSKINLNTIKTTWGLPKEGNILHHSQ